MDIGNFLQSLLAPQPVGNPGWMQATGAPEMQAPQPQGGGADDFLKKIFAQATGGGEPVNVMQQAGIDLNMPQAAPVSQAPIQQQAPSRPRRSFLDTVGGISDVLAKVGGAEALYQPTLDARQDRAFKLDDRGRQALSDEQKLAAGQFELGDKGNALVGQAIRGLQAIQKGGGDITTAWPLLAKQAGIPDDRAAVLGQIFGSNPEAIEGISAMLNAQDQPEFGLQPFYAKGPDGQLQAYQLGKDGKIQQIELPEGAAPIDPIKFVDLGNQQAGVGSRSGNTLRILPKGEAPGKAADRGSRERIAGIGIASRERIAAMKGGGKAPAAATGAMVETAQSSLDELRKIYGDLNKMGAMVSPKKGTGANIAARVRASAAGQLAEGAIGTEAQTLRDRIGSIRPGLMQSLAKATGMTGKQLDSNADVKLFMQTVTNPTASYEANLAAVAGLERFLAANTKRQSAPPRSGNSPKPARRASGPTVSNW